MVKTGCVSIAFWGECLKCFNSEFDLQRNNKMLFVRIKNNLCFMPKKGCFTVVFFSFFAKSTEEQFFFYYVFVIRTSINFVNVSANVKHVSISLGVCAIWGRLRPSSK